MSLWDCLSCGTRSSADFDFVFVALRRVIMCRLRNPANHPYDALKSSHPSGLSDFTNFFIFTMNHLPLAAKPTILSEDMAHKNSFDIFPCVTNFAMFLKLGKNTKEKKFQKTRFYGKKFSSVHKINKSAFPNHVKRFIIPQRSLVFA